MKRKALAFLLSFILTVGMSSAAFADEHSVPETENEPHQTATPVTALPATPVQTPGTEQPSSSMPESGPGTENEPEAGPGAEPGSEPGAEPGSEPGSEPGIEAGYEPEDKQPLSSEGENSRNEPENSGNTQQPSPSSQEESQPEESGSSPDDPDDMQNNNNGMENEPPDEEEEEIPDDIEYIPPPEVDLFSPRAMLFSVPEIQGSNIPPANENEVLSGATNNSGSRWIPVSGIPDVDGAVVPASAKLVFAIPSDNFATSATTGGSFAANAATLNNTCKNLVMIGAASAAGTFNINFTTTAASGAGRAYAVELTPMQDKIPDDGLLLPKGTTFGFSGNVNLYALPADLLIASGKTNKSKAVGITPGAELGGAYTWTTRNGVVESVDFYNLDDAMAGDEFLIHFSPMFFEWDGPVPAKVTLTNIRSKISLRHTGSAGSRVFETIELASSKSEAVVRIKFRDDLLSTKPVDFNAKIYLTVSGRRHEDSMLETEGVFGDMEPIEYYSEDKDLDISDGSIGIAMESMSMVKLYIGDGVTLTVPNIRKGSRFYGTANMNFDAYGEELVEKYPDIVEAYVLKVLGLNGAGVKVDIDTGGGFHVYDKDLKYLGNSTRKLEFSETYYLAANELDIEGDMPPDEEWGDGEYEPEDDIPPSQNTNKNPGTGR